MSTLRAHFDGKYFIPDEPVNLPEGTRVTLTVISGDTNGNAGGPAAKSLKDLLRIADDHPITDSPPDWSEQHDHYIHGSPKR